MFFIGSFNKILSTILIVHLEYGRFRKCNGVGIYVDNLIPQHARHIGDVQPSVILLGDELGEADLSFALHLNDEVEEILSLVSTAPLTPPNRRSTPEGAKVKGG